MIKLTQKILKVIIVFGVGFDENKINKEFKSSNFIMYKDCAFKLVCI